MSESVGASELWVCWALPPTEPDEQSPVLSFLPPGLEDRVGHRRREHFILARETDQAVRDEARQLYLEVVARIGLAPIKRSQTLRSALAPSGKGSRWWYHPVSFRDCEHELTFKLLLSLLTIQAVASQYGVKRLVLVGAPDEIASALGSTFEVRVMQSQRCRSLWLAGILALARRVLFLVRTARLCLAVRAWRTDAHVSAEVALCGFWEWSVRWDEQNERICDRYFQLLPDYLRKQSCSLRWFVWLDPAELGKERRSLKEAFGPLCSCQDVVLLQSFLGIWEVMKEAANLGPVLSYGRAAASRSFRSIFAARGLDLFPLFAAPLLEGFLGPGIPACVLMETAMARAASVVRPRAIISFLEHFPLARAQYEGYRQSGCQGTTIAVQHASFSREKTFMFLHPTYEFRGEPDGYAVPTPDLVCAMGTQSRELFLECGYSGERVLVTGSTRYDHIRVEPGSDHGRCGGPTGGDLTVLVVASHAVNQEIDLIEALCSATEGMVGIVLWLRPHPLSKVDAHPRFRSFRDRFTVVGGPLSENLLRSTLVVFTYSTVAEEALLKGKPVWQWLPRQFNGSALAEAFPVIPRFGSVARLRQALQDFQADPTRFLPSEDLRRAVCERLFFRDDGQAAARVASIVEKVVRGSTTA